VSFEDLLAESDFLTIHVPATSETSSLIGPDELARMKPTAWIVNCARGGIADEAALLDALERGVIAGAALDVFTVEPATDNPLTRHPKVVATPHLAASTQEAQVNVAVQTAEQMLLVLQGEPAPFAVNAPPISAESARFVTPFAPLAQILGNVCRQLVQELAGGQLESVEITYSGEIVEHDTSTLTASVIRGLLEPISEEKVTLINAHLVARNRGLRVSERKSSEPENYTNLITIRAGSSRGSSLVGGTLLNDEPHIVRLDEYSVGLVPTGDWVLLTRHEDRPGMIHAVTGVLGTTDINISAMQLGRERRRGPALMLMLVDDPVPTQALEAIRKLPGIERAHVLKI
jgi:D-3-phosphoglycerate dehydrogenase